MVQPAPAAALEVVQPQLVLELLVQLLAHPARLDQGGQGLERGLGRQVREVVLALAARPGARRPATPPRPAGAGRRAAAGPSATRTRNAANSASSGPLVPVRHETARNAAGRASSSSAAPTLAAEGTGCLRGRPVGLRSGKASVTSAG